MREALTIHEHYVTYYTNCKTRRCAECKALASKAGDKRWHRKWVGRYRRVLKVLESI